MSCVGSLRLTALWHILLCVFWLIVSGTWRVGGLSKQVVSRVVSTLNGILIGDRVLITL